jgi:hypothetical protein
MPVSFDIPTREQELRKRLDYPYQWGQKQSDEWDEKTDFVYHLFSFEALLKELEVRFGGLPEAEALTHYGMTRWYNFWSAKAIEQIFCSHPLVHAAPSRQDRIRDFRIGEIHFDHKTSIYPRGFNRDLAYGQSHPRDLIEWLYTHQSQQRRKHIENRLFVMLYASDGQHWKLKAELGWLSTIIGEYLDHFDPSKLHRFRFHEGKETVADVIWAVR